MPWNARKSCAATRQEVAWKFGATRLRAGLVAMDTSTVSPIEPADPESSAARLGRCSILRHRRITLTAQMRSWNSGGPN